jgi:CubicO group peptidase (beta-lactamase class C family)
VLTPLGMATTEMRGSPAHGVRSTATDMLRFVAELRVPRLITQASADAFHTVQFPGLAGLVPGVGRYDDCPWGLGTEIRGSKQPHWTGSCNSPGTYGHFGGAGTLLWVDPGAHVACLALTDRPFDEWSAEALLLWPALADAVLAEALA